MRFLKNNQSHGFGRCCAMALTVVSASASIFLPFQQVFAQYHWKDETGRMIISDQPPPPHISDKNFIKRPAKAIPPTVPTMPATPNTPQAFGQTKVLPAANVGTAQNGAPLTLAEKEAEFRKKQKELEDKLKQTKEDQSRQKANQESCDRSKGYLRSLEEGVRISMTDKNGERAFLEDNQRDAEINRVRQQMREACSK
jgi:hypothetical protein